MKFWNNWELRYRVAALFGLVACLVMAGLGFYLYASVRQAMEMRADYTLIGRVEHFRNLFHDLYDIKQMEERPGLFESMLGNEQDVRIFKRVGDAPFIQVNPGKLTPPAMSAVPVGTAIGIDALRTGQADDGVRVRWVSALARLGTNKDTIEITAAYVMTQESRVLSTYLYRVMAAIALTALLTTALAFIILQRGLRPIKLMYDKAAEITPAKLSARFGMQDAPPELRSLTEAFDAMLDRLEKGYQHLNQFSADLAHEVRTPVNIMMGQSQVALRQARSAAEYEQVLESNVEELSRLARIIENILFLANADQEAVVADRVEIDLITELEKIAEYFEPLAEERQMRFVVTATGNIFANLIMWRRAVNNLVLNAIRYGKSGTTIQLISEQNEEAGTLSVINQCEASMPVDTDRMFDRFYRGDASRSAYTESNGLGLSIVRAIMHLHHGTASVTYLARENSICFKLEFPGK
ncbi:heavy metal sensor histidine kinase [Undibacterium sp. CY18W]|uniref:Sensor protein n=1 Tax=Undibacterium hunanense TaxID=2762292 RepID=A0ABR6ZKV1_9BURK|nr:heavy metal sensor histidine kinase [Undibacterium hunanense]MBC3916519.1 heavy metal sensor histidine kinase [Undibacterium hunanense]